MSPNYAATTDQPSSPLPVWKPVRARVLIISGNFLQAATWREALLRRHFAVSIAQPDRALQSLCAGDFADVILLDLADSACEALALCRRLRASGITQPILMLHPLGTLDDLLAGFEAGADAYLRGWVGQGELFGQIGALCRRR